MFTGNLTENGSGKTMTFSGTISTLFWDINVTIEPNTMKSADNHPDFAVLFNKPGGKTLRIGSMWEAKGKDSGNVYYSISLQDRHGNQWRMNAVRNDETPKKEWEIVPLAGGNITSVPVDGKIERLDDGNLFGEVGSYDFDMKFTAIAVEAKQSDAHPDYRIEATSRSGKTIRMGSIWKQISQKGNEYLSMTFYTPTGEQHRANAMLDDITPEHDEAGQEVATAQTWTIIQLVNAKPEVVAA